MDVLLACVRQARHTGFTLTHVRVVRELVWGAHLRAVRSGWEAEETAKALGQAEAVMVGLEDPALVEGEGEKKAGKKTKKVVVVNGEEEGGSEGRPEILGVLLELAAATRAKGLVGEGEGKDEDGKVAFYATRLEAAWKKAVFLKWGGDDAQGGNKKEGKYWIVANYELMKWAPVWNGIKLALKVLPPGTNVANALKGRLAHVRRYLDRARAVVEKGAVEAESRRG